MIRWYDDIRCIIIVTNLLTNVYINVLTFFAHRWNCTYLNYVWNAILRYLCFGYIHILCLGANKLDIIVIFWRNFTTMKCRSRAVEHFTLKYNYSANNNRTFGMMVRCRRGVCTSVLLCDVAKNEFVNINVVSHYFLFVMRLLKKSFPCCVSAYFWAIEFDLLKLFGSILISRICTNTTTKELSTSHSFQSRIQTILIQPYCLIKLIRSTIF